MSYIIFVFLLIVIWHFRQIYYFPVVIYSHLTILALLLFNLHSEGIWLQNISHLYTSNNHSGHVIKVNFVILLFCATGYFFSFRARQIVSDLNTGEQNFSLRALIIWHRDVSKVLLLFIGLITTLLLVHFIIIDFDRLFSYSRYLAIRSPDYVGVKSGIFAFLHINLINILLLFTVLIAFSLAARNWVLVCSLIPGYFYVFIYSMAQHSRASALSIFLIAVVCYATRFRVMSLVLFGLAALFYFHAIEIRGQGRLANERFGLERFVKGGVLFKNFDAIETLQYSLFNANGAAFNLAMYFERGAPVQGNIDYKIKSFSPFPSFVDGFASIRDVQLRFAAHCPYSTYSELLSFGWKYVICFLIFLAWCFEANIQVLSRNRYLGMLCGAPLMYTILYIGAYPIRNTFRFVLISIIISLITLFFFKRRTKVSIHTTNH